MNKDEIFLSVHPNLWIQALKTVLASESGERSYLLLRKDFTVANFYNNGLLSVDKLTILMKNNSGNFHRLSMKTFAQADLETIADEFKSKPKKQVKNRGNWSREESFYWKFL